MRLPDERIELAASTDPERENLNCVHFDRERAQLEASNGSIAAVVPIENGTWADEDRTSKLSLDAVEAARKELRRKLSMTDEAERENVRKVGVEITATPEGVTTPEGKFFPCPDSQEQFPDFGRMPWVTDPTKYDVVISLDAGLLHRLAKAMTAEGKPWVRIYARGGDARREIYIEPVPKKFGEDAPQRRPFGFIMPVADHEMDVLLGRETAAKEKSKDEAGADA